MLIRGLLPHVFMVTTVFLMLKLNSVGSGFEVQVLFFFSPFSLLVFCRYYSLLFDFISSIYVFQAWFFIFVHLISFGFALLIPFSLFCSFKKKNLDNKKIMIA